MQQKLAGNLCRRTWLFPNSTTPEGKSETGSTWQQESAGTPVDLQVFCQSGSYSLLTSNWALKQRARDLEGPDQTLADQPPFKVRLPPIPRRESGLAGDGQHSGLPWSQSPLGLQSLSTGCILPDEESPTSPEFPVLQLVISQVKDADLLCRVLGDVREAPRGQKPRQGPVDYINASFRMSPQVCETGESDLARQQRDWDTAFWIQSLYWKYFNICMSLYIL